MTENEALRIVANPHLKWKCHEVDSALTIIRNALEKQVAKKPIELDTWGEYYKCPTCGKYAVDENGGKYKFCPNCGQKLDWSEE